MIEKIMAPSPISLMMRWWKFLYIVGTDGPEALAQVKSGIPASVDVPAGHC